MKNFYQPEVIVIPSDLAGGVLVAAHFLQFESLRIKAIERFAQSLNLRTISKFFQCANKCQETKAIESCENWLCIHLFENMTNSKLLRQIPFDFLKKVINSNR